MQLHQNFTFILESDCIIWYLDSFAMINRLKNDWMVNSNLITFTSRPEQVSYQDCTWGNFPFTKIDKKDMRNYLPIEISQVSDKLVPWRIRLAAVALFMGYRCDTERQVTCDALPVV